MDDKAERKAGKGLEERVVSAAEAALHEDKHVTLIDIYLRLGFLSPSLLARWRAGALPSLAGSFNAGPEKLARARKILCAWALSRGLASIEREWTVFSGLEVEGLRVTESGDPEAEKIYRTCFVAEGVSEISRKRLKAKLDKPREIVVFSILRPSICSRCGQEMHKNQWLRMEREKPLCLQCAGLEGLEYLPAGDAKLTRLSRKYSKTAAVVVRFSRARKRYERQGLLVEPAALARARLECGGRPHVQGDSV